MCTFSCVSSSMKWMGFVSFEFEYWTFLDPNIFWTQKFLGPKHFLDSTVLDPKFLDLNLFGTQNFFYLNYFYSKLWNKKKLDPTYVLDPKFVEPRVFGSIYYWTLLTLIVLGGRNHQPSENCNCDFSEPLLDLRPVCTLELVREVQ